MLIYLLKPSQERLFEVLARSLRVGGYLSLGEAEYVAKSERSGFVAVDRRAGLYRRIGAAREEGRYGDG
jgi:chemotaxis methyl-accepting protein methylase